MPVFESTKPSEDKDAPTEHKDRYFMMYSQWDQEGRAVFTFLDEWQKSGANAAAWASIQGRLMFSLW